MRQDERKALESAPAEGERPVCVVLLLRSGILSNAGHV